MRGTSLLSYVLYGAVIFFCRFWLRAANASASATLQILLYKMCCQNRLPLFICAFFLRHDKNDIDMYTKTQRIACNLLAYITITLHFLLSNLLFVFINSEPY